MHLPPHPATARGGGATIECKTVEIGTCAVVAPGLTAIKRWFFLDRRYDSQFANSCRWFFFVCWLGWLLMVVMVSVLGPDWVTAILGFAMAGIFVVMYRILFKVVSKANNWKQLDLGGKK